MPGERKISPKVHVGCSGFSYDHWKGVFYPEGLSGRKWLEYYARKFETLELNVTFYRLPAESAFEKWKAETPEGFLISVKGSRYITHVKRLTEPAEPLKKFFDRVRELGEKLAVVLWQLPPGFKSDYGRLRDFLKAARRFRARNVFEFRHESWINQQTLDLLREEGCAVCMADWPPFINDLPLTAGFAYIRRHGHGSYGQSYTRAELEEDARRIGHYSAAAAEVFIYFNNDAQGYAPRNALELLEILRHKKDLKKVLVH
jgi:uncharacterized protein YecE (DUF72 family)